MRTRGGRVYYRSGGYKISMVRMSIGLTNFRMYGSKGWTHRNVCRGLKPSMWGKVKLECMKFLIVLQALSSIQDYRKNLRIYEKLVIMERGKLPMWRTQFLWNSIWGKLKRGETEFYGSESRGIVLMKSW